MNAPGLTGFLEFFPLVCTRMQPRSLEEIGARLRRAGARANTELGQHFLADFSVIEKAIAAAGLVPGEQVVEVGPGLGVLSEALLDKGVEVTAFEIDPMMVRVLREDLPALRVVPGDVLIKAPEVLAQLGVYKVVANIPYQISSPLLKLFLETDVPRPISLTMLIQKEMGERLAAKAGDSARSFISILIELQCEVSIVCKVPPSAFVPPPAVDSVVVHIKVRETPLVMPELQRDFLRFIKVSFLGRRKQLKNVLAGIRGCGHEEMGDVLESLGLLRSARAQELSLDSWLALYTKFYP